MYLQSLDLTNFRVFRHAKLKFLHCDQRATAARPKPRYPNINLLLGNNGAGKTTLLKAIALTALGPAAGTSGIYPYRLVRREPLVNGRPTGKEPIERALLMAKFRMHEQDQSAANEAGIMQSEVAIVRNEDVEEFQSVEHERALWQPIYRERSEAFFCVGYGATRRVERQKIDPGGRRSTQSMRATRVQGLFEDSYSLIPLNAWLPEFLKVNPGRYSQIKTLISGLLGPDRFTFTAEQEDGEYLFERDGLRVPFPALSDGYRAYLGWIGDLLYHVTQTCPPGKKLVENKGIILIDEIDLHLHPEWQMTVLPTLARELPNIQFVVTSHSPLVASSLEPENILLMSAGPKHSAKPIRFERSIHGLDADQVLLTEYFGLKTTRAGEKPQRLKDLTLKARGGDAKAALQLLAELSSGQEAAT